MNKYKKYFNYIVFGTYSICSISISSYLLCLFCDYFFYDNFYQFNSSIHMNISIPSLLWFAFSSYLTYNKILENNKTFSFILNDEYENILY